MKRSIVALIALGLAFGCSSPAVAPLVPEPPSPPSDAVTAPSENVAAKLSTSFDEASATPEAPVQDDLPPEPLDASGVQASAVPHPLDDVSDEEVRRLVKEDPESLGSMSLGRPNGGALINAVQMPADDRWVLVDPGLAYGTQETIDNLQRVIVRVDEQFADTPPLYIGHISGRSGGHLSPHLSHQSGRDVDLGYYYSNGGTWYQRATESNLDVARTWALVRAIITETDVRFLLIDRSVQQLLRAHAESIGEDAVWLDYVFKGINGKEQALIRHVPGHATHLHVRFRNPRAEETARRCYSALVELGKVKPPTYFVHHKARKGDSLIKLAKQYGTTVRTIQRANGMRGTVIFARKTYKIPRKGVPAQSNQKVEVPARRLPPTDPRIGARQ